MPETMRGGSSPPPKKSSQPARNFLWEEFSKQKKYRLSQEAKQRQMAKPKGQPTNSMKKK